MTDKKEDKPVILPSKIAGMISANMEEIQKLQQEGGQIQREGHRVQQMLQEKVNATGNIVETFKEVSGLGTDYVLGPDWKSLIKKEKEPEKEPDKKTTTKQPTKSTAKPAAKTPARK